MLFSVGTKVKFLHTGDEGVITKRLTNGMVNVYLKDSDMEIPVFPEDLIKAEQFLPKPEVKAKIIKGKVEQKPLKPERPNIESQYTILKSYGIQIAFDPVLKADGSTDKYVMYLLNDSKNDFIFDLVLKFHGEEEQDWNGKLEKTSFIKLGSLLFDDLNDAPSFDMNCWKTTTEGKGKKMTKTLKIKAKQFFKNIRTAPFLNKSAHIYRIFENLDSEQTESKEDLKSYTKKNVRPVKFRNRDSNIGFYNQFDSKEFSEFETEIDLHIEKLIEKPHKMSNAEIVRIQLSHFESFLTKAIRLGVPTVFIIHGVGKGRLKNEIASRLIQNPQVKTFKNEFHPRYGWGATEVIF